MGRQPKRELVPKVLEVAKHFESFRPYSYPDPASPLGKATRGMKLRWGFRRAQDILETLPEKLQVLDGSPWTIGYGHTGGGTVKPSMGPWTEEQALKRLDIDLDEAQLHVEKLVKYPINAHQYGALCLLMMNTGPKPWLNSNLLRTINAGELDKVPEILKKWNKARNRDTGQLEPWPGLTRRRIAEADLWLTPVEVPEEIEEELPEDSQAPEPAEPKPLMKSRTVAGSTVATVGTAGAAATEQLEQIRGLSEPLVEASEIMKWVFIGATLVGIALIVYARIELWRKEKG